MTIDEFLSDGPLTVGEAAQFRGGRHTIEPLMTKRQAADVLGVCARSVDNFIARGQLKVVRLGARTKIDPRDLREFIDAMKVN